MLWLLVEVEADEYEMGIIKDAVDEVVVEQ
jgi:hypothetical protein